MAAAESLCDNREPGLFGPDTVDTPDQKGSLGRVINSTLDEDYRDKKKTGRNQDPVWVIL